IEHKQEFEDELLNEAVNVREKIEEIRQIGNINLVVNAHRLILYVLEAKELELISFAKQEGKVWAEFSITLSFKLEWIQSIRRTLWKFLQKYGSFNEFFSNKDEFFEVERSLNKQIDQFLHYFFISYSDF